MPIATALVGEGHLKMKMPPLDVDSEIYYEIKVKGHLEEHWSDWLGGLKISHDAQGYSLLTGMVSDQAALYGILGQIRNLGLPLISLLPQNASVEEKQEV